MHSVHHDEAPIHETGHQLMQTGRLFRHGEEHPHYGAVLSTCEARGRKGCRRGWCCRPLSATLASALATVRRLATSARDTNRWCWKPSPARLSGRKLLQAVDAAHRACDTAGLRPACSAAGDKQAFNLDAESDDLRTRYGRNTFGQSCLLARRLVENGVRLATVNMFDCVFDAVTWDCHADCGSLATTLDDYRDTLCPMFDRAYTALLEDLKQRGLLEKTLVLAMGEFGRTPELNPRGGRDHWPGCWTVLFAGGGVRGGQVLAVPIALGGAPKDRPVTPAEVAATVYTRSASTRVRCCPVPTAGRCR